MALPKAAAHQRNGDGGGVEGPAPERPDMSKDFPLVVTPRQARHWAKQYRTEIAAGSSSILSTFSAVSLGILVAREGRMTDITASIP